MARVKKKPGRKESGLWDSDLKVQMESLTENTQSVNLPESKLILELAREDPVVFGFFVFGWLAADHHEEWVDFVTKNPDGSENLEDCGISAPPAFAKTNWIGVVMTSFYLGKYPDRHVIYVSKTGFQAEKVSVPVRNTIEYNKRFHAVFPNCKPNPDQGWGEKEWYLQRPNTGDKDASFFAVGIGGPILGARGDLIVIDDPQDKTTSGTPFQRDKAVGYIKEQVMTRKSKIGRALFIMTRWHVDDVAGYYISNDVPWIIMPALGCKKCGYRCVCGKPQLVSNWPDEHTTKKLIKLRDEDPIMFEKVYQGNPRSKENQLFDEQAWQYYDPDDMPKILLDIQVWDTAQTEEEQSSYSVCAHWAKCENGCYYLLDLWRERVQFPDLLNKAKELYQIQMPTEVWIEAKSSGIQLLQSLEAETGIPADRINPEGSKWERARAISPIQTNGRCFLPKDADWVYDFVEEHSVFMGRFTDQVDTTAHALKILRKVAGEVDFTAELPKDTASRFRVESRDTPDRASLDWAVISRDDSRWRKFSRRSEEVY